MNTTRATWAYLLLLLPLIYFAIFLHLDSRIFRIWDEAILGVHTYDMMHDHDYIVSHSFGEPEMWSTKPPLVIWFMVLSCKIFGFNELGIRMPNALSAIGVCFLIFFFVVKTLKTPLRAFLSVLVLISSTGYVFLHVTRSGEYDAFLVLFVAVYCLSYFLLLGNIRSRRLWVLFTLALACAILTKGVAALLVLPALFLFTIIDKKLLTLVRTKEVYISIFITSFIGIGFYFLREHYNPGYINAVMENELGGRYLKPQFPSTPWMYLDLLVNEHFKNWVSFALIGAFAGLLAPDRSEKRLTLFLTLIVATLLLLLSLSATRLNWYDAPAFPFLAILAGSGLYFVVNWLSKLVGKNHNIVGKAAIALLIILITLPAYTNIIILNLSTDEPPWEADAYNLTHYIEWKEKNGANLTGYKVLPDWHMCRAAFCQVKKWENNGQKIEVIMDAKSLQAGDRVIVGEDGMKAQIDRQFDHRAIDSYKNVEVWGILGPKRL